MILQIEFQRVLIEMVEYMRMVVGDLRERALLTELVGGSERVCAGPPLTAD